MQGDNIVVLPSSDVVARDPDRPWLMQIEGPGTRFIRFPMVPGTSGGELVLDVYAMDVDDITGAPTMVPVANETVVVGPVVRIKPRTDPPEYIPFYAKRSYKDGTTPPTETVILLEAEEYPPTPGTVIRWSVDAAVGSISHETPADRVGSTFSFVPNPGSHPTYQKENGSRLKSVAPSYVVGASAFGFVDAILVVQDEVDTIIQEYLAHDIADLMPERGQFAPATASPRGYYSSSEINNTAYSVIPGNPGEFADAVMDRFNELMGRDIVRAERGSTLPSPASVVIDGGATVVVDEVSRATVSVVTTPKCYPGAPGSCDDTYRLDSVYGLPIAISAGPDRIANTTARTFAVAAPGGGAGLLKPPMNSGWRNPERNESVGGARRSVHQVGGAADFGIPGSETISATVLWCVLLQAARDLPSVYAQTETGASTSSVDCITPGVTHVHAQRN